MKYTQEKKAEALARIAEIGVMKTSEEMHISIQTLYKWRNETNAPDTAPEQVAPKKSAPKGPATVTDDIKQIIINDKSLEKKIQTLEKESAALRDENKALLETNAKMKRALIAMLG